MEFNEYLHFFSALAWLAGAMAAAALAVAPGAPTARHGGWLLATCVSLALTRAAGFLSPALDRTAPLNVELLGTLLSTALSWEFARRTWNDTGRRHLSAGTHALVVEAVLMLAAIAFASRDAPPSWADLVRHTAEYLPLAVGALGWCLVWRRLSSAAARGALGLGLGGVALGGLALLPAAWGAAGAVLASLAAAAGLGAAAYRQPEVRSRGALVFGSIFLLTAIFAPVVTGLAIERAQLRYRQTALATVRDAAQAMNRSATGQFARDADPAAGRVLHAEVRKLVADDAAIRRAALWRLREGRIEVLGADGKFTVSRISEPLERAGELTTAPFYLSPPFFVRPSDNFAAHAPLRLTRFDSPVAWLVIEYPAVFYTRQLDTARRVSGAVAALLAAFCTAAFILAVRQAGESHQRSLLDQAVSASRAKTEFLAFLSHELRTPLQSVLGRAELLRRTALNSDQSRHTDAIETQGRLLLRLVTDLLDLGTIEAGKLELKPGPFGLRSLLTTLEDAHRPLAAAHGLALQVEVAPEIPERLVGDEARLRQILGNLLGNALKYTAHGEVRLQVFPTPGDTNLASLLFRVIDTGPGLPADQHEKLFTLFTRLDNGGDFRREGTGVGLALVRRLCTLMGGVVSAANRPEGGAEFVARLAFPLAAEPRDTAAVTPARSPARHVLVADDNAAVRDFLVEALRALGHTAETAGDGPAAFAAARNGSFDAVILDINLPGRDGISVARELRSTRPGLRLVGCSAEAFARARESALAAGMDAFLEKPVSIDALGTALERAVATGQADDIFARLRDRGAAAHTWTLLANEWPIHHRAALAALDTGNVDSLRALAHYLQSSALLAEDAVLLELCRRLTAAAVGSDFGECRATLAALDQRVAAFNPPA